MKDDVDSFSGHIIIYDEHEEKCYFEFDDAIKKPVKGDPHVHEFVGSVSNGMKVKIYALFHDDIWIIHRNGGEPAYINDKYLMFCENGKSKKIEHLNIDEVEKMALILKYEEAPASTSSFNIVYNKNDE